MARLTRTQKYAELRDEISHDREESLNTQELNSYANQLNSLNGYNESILTRSETKNIVEEVKKVEDESMKSLDDILKSMMAENFTNAVNTVPEKEQPKMAEFVEKPQVANPTPEAVQPTNNNFINETLDEVNVYNKEAGNTTLDNLSSTLIDEVRHPENVNNAVDDEFSKTISLELDKVLNEIDSIEEPVQNNNVFVQEETAVEEPIEVKTVEEEIVQEKIEEVKEEPIQPVVIDETQKEETFEHPVLTQTLEQPAVEIKNISETVQVKPMQPVVDIVDDTIPFTLEESDDDEEYEEEPSKALNVILGVLIFVLVAVLGVIVYYILIAKGIIKWVR